MLGTSQSQSQHGLLPLPAGPTAELGACSVCLSSHTEALGNPACALARLVTLRSPSMGLEETRAARLFQATSPRAPLAD